MIVPIRCFSCGKVRPPSRAPTRRMLTPNQVTGDLWERYMVMLTQENKLEVYGRPLLLPRSPRPTNPMPLPSRVSLLTVRKANTRPATPSTNSA